MPANFSASNARLVVANFFAKFERNPYLMQPGSVFAGLILGLFQRFPVYCSLFIVFDIKKDSPPAVLCETNNK